MKKLLIGFSSIFAFLTVSCSTSTPKVNPTINKNENKLYKNKYVSKLLNLYLSDSKLRDSYINDQENVSDSKFSELKYGLTFYPIFIHRSLDYYVGQHYRVIIQKAKNSLEQTLRNDWYWVLDNITNFKYNFNPYGDLYNEFNKDEDLFKQVEKDLGSLISSIKNKNVQNIIRVNLNNSINEKIKDDYFKKEALYLVFDNNKAIKIWKYEYKNKIEFLMTSDLFVFKDANNLENQIEQLENTIFEKRKSEYNNNLESINKSIETTKKRKEKTQQEIQELKEKIEKLEKETNTTTTAPLALALDTRTIAPGVLKNDKKKEPTIEELKKDLEKKEKQLEQFDENVKKYEKDIEDLPQKSNDKKFLEFHAKNQYNERLKESLNEINKDGWKIVRFSMRGIYEQE
ncbi:aromatic motif membrane protein [Mycoplasma mycoides]|uniref:aromatic motif membrane protein n=1 Tax=Mycoplasma mycoides TaxID=2102 RepID=UPI000540E26B|nr:aromatic motif membrane protein [Mycoplasma mycoides]AIZ55787.1 hypothetical protein mycmycITA_00974 [Mycoplasma mycoides subsp. mycoides]PTD31848.1 putative lipoprotein [Mycoplasma mycoides subsp. mycoides B345/93]PTD31852.1 putative lipoprotein [Mycoplasma mycoides subsp. mycoides C425/93]PTD33409.1 putative lipoprotein [Mycoplasma mycoides subsp. mycoides PO-67]BCU84676.1 hypothetical protein mmcaprivi_10550 [Mycoplasma mycoides]